MTTTIKAKKTLYNGGRCFTEGKEYTIKGIVKTEAGLIDSQTINDQNEPHIIGSWWRDFEIVSAQS
jgi:hypothetical protein